MVKKKSLPDEPDNWYLVGDSERDIDLTKHKASEKEEWLNYDIGNPDFQRLFRRVKGFYRGSCSVPVYVPDDLAPFLDRAMLKFKFSSKYEALLYILTLRSCEYVADFISGTMYDYAVDHALNDLSYHELDQLYDDLFGSKIHGNHKNEIKKESFEGISHASALSIASFLKYITGNLSVSSRKENFSVDESFFSFLGETPDRTDEIPIGELHKLAVVWESVFPGKLPSVVFKKYASLEESLSFERERVRALIKEKVDDKQEYERCVSALRSDLEAVRKRASSYEGRIDALNREIRALKDEYEHGLIFSLKSFFRWLKRRFK